MKRSKKQKVAIFIDGSNFYHYLKKNGFSKNQKFSFSHFIKYILGQRSCVSKRYYTGIFCNYNQSQKGADLVLGQQKFLAKLENQGFIIKRGKILYDNAQPREKGTDVKIAIDLVIGAVDNQFETAILISSDTDLIPAVKYVQYKNKNIEYIGFANCFSQAMKNTANSYQLLTSKEIMTFFIQKC